MPDARPGGPDLTKVPTATPGPRTQEGPAAPPIWRAFRLTRPADGRRQQHLTATVTATVDACAGVGGLAARYDEDHGSPWGRAAQSSPHAHLAGLAQTWQATVPAGEVGLRMEMARPRSGFTLAAAGGDRIGLVAGGTVLAELDGRYWTAET